MTFTCSLNLVKTGKGDPISEGLQSEMDRTINEAEITDHIRPTRNSTTYSFTCRGFIRVFLSY